MLLAMSIFATNLRCGDGVSPEFSMLSSALQCGRSNIGSITLFVSTLLASVLAMPAVSGTLEDLIRSGALPSVPKKPSSVFKIDHVKQKGRVTLVLFSDREPGTRTAIHTHDDAGVTCIVQGEMTLYMEGVSPIRKQAGDCYYMPSGVRMIGFNSGKVVAKFYDFFNFKEGGTSLSVVEGKGCDSKGGVLDEFCALNPYMQHH